MISDLKFFEASEPKANLSLLTPENTPQKAMQPK
jgi:hypothetical protein